MDTGRSQEELDLIETRYYGASGFGPGEVAFLGVRYNELRGFPTGDGESWICDTYAHPSGAQTRFHRGHSSLFSGIWRSPTGRCFAALRLGPGVSGPTMLVNRDLGEPGAVANWTEFVFPDPGALNGVWGLADDYVYAWGSAGRPGTHFFYRWDGSDFRAMPSPDFVVTAVHGASESCLVAVGSLGQIAVFDGGGWRRMSSPTNEYLTSVFVESPSLAFAVGTRGNVLEGSEFGWGKVAAGPRMPTEEGVPLYAVALWGGELWVGAGVAGLFKRRGQSAELECVDPTATALSLDVRRGLVAACFYRIVTSTDGVLFESTAENALREHREGRFLTEW